MYLYFPEQARKRAVSLGESAIGGEWELLDTKGKPVSNKDLFGQWLILYFGFTHCPDICPDELDKIVLAVNMIGMFMWFIVTWFHTLGDKLQFSYQTLYFSLR